MLTGSELRRFVLSLWDEVLPESETASARPTGRAFFRLYSRFSLCHRPHASEVSGDSVLLPRGARFR